MLPTGRRSRDRLRLDFKSAGMFGIQYHSGCILGRQTEFSFQLSYIVQRQDQWTGDEVSATA
jgi:hypothetical protein